LKTRHYDRRRLKRWVVVLVLAGTLLVGCGRRVPATWPDLSVVDGVVYLANGQIFAMEAATGKLLWNYPGAPQRSGGLLSGCSAPQATDGPFVAAPAVGAEFVFLASGGDQQQSLLGKGKNMAGLRALNNFGVLQWRFDEATQSAVASPVLDEGTVYLASSDRHVYAIDVQTRDTRWVFETTKWVWAVPLVAQDTVYIASMDHVLYAVDAATGEVEWKFDRPQSALPTAPALVQGTLYLNALDGWVYAIDAQTGALEWEHKIDGSVWGTPLVQDGFVYLGTLHGAVYALDAADGTQVWSQDVGGEVRSTPAYVDGKLYVGCQDGQLYVFDAQDGSKNVSPLGAALEKASIYTSPVFDGQYLYVVATDGRVFALDLDKDIVVWEKNPVSDQEGN